MNKPLRKAAAPAVRALIWTARPPEGLEGDMRAIYALGVGGHYAAYSDGLLWWAHDPFSHQEFATRGDAMKAAQEDHERRVLSLLCLGLEPRSHVTTVGE